MAECPSGAVMYTINQGDTLFLIAQMYNTTVDLILATNPDLDPFNLYVGQVICLYPNFEYTMMNGEMNFNDMNSNDMNSRDMNSNDMNSNDMNSRDMNSNGMNSNGMNSNGMNSNGMNSNGMNSNGMNSRDMNSNGMNFNDMNFNDMNSSLMYPSRMELSNYLRMLWVQHVVWTRLTILSMIFDLPDVDMVTNRLLRNPKDFEALLMPLYGEEEAARFSDLLTSHLEIAAELVKAAIADDNSMVEDADKRWHENADEIAAFLEDINPYWSQDDWEAMLYEHLDLLKNEVVEILSGNYEDGIDTFDMIEQQALEMADMMTDGIANQFPDFN